MVNKKNEELKMKNVKYSLASSLITLALTLLYCGGKGGSPVALNVKIYTPDPQLGIDPFQEVSFLKISVIGSGIDDTLSKIVQYPGNKESILPEIPFGSKRQITVEGCKAQECNEPDIVARGRSIPITVSSEGDIKNLSIYITSVNSFTPTTSSVTKEESKPVREGRVGATFTVLDDGRILITGGALPSTFAGSDFQSTETIQEVYDDVEIFDQGTMEFSDILVNGKPQKMTIPRAFHSAVKLSDGRVAILGGLTKLGGGNAEGTSTVEIYDPSSNTFTQDKNDKGENIGLVAARVYFTATVVEPQIGIILCAGGKGKAQQSWEAYLPGTGTVDWDDWNSLKIARWNHTATFLPTIKGEENKKVVLIIGGENSGGVVNSVEVFDVLLDWGGVGVGKMDKNFEQEIPGGGRTLHTSTFLPSQGLVYVAGGFKDKEKKEAINRVDIYNVGDGKFSGNLLLLNTPRGTHSAVAMDNNTILLSGGRNASNVLSNSEIIFEVLKCQNPDDPNTCYYEVNISSELPLMKQPRMGHISVFLDTKTALIVGGFKQSEGYIQAPQAEIFNPM